MPSPTINTKAALADVLAMFGAPLPGDAAAAEPAVVFAPASKPPARGVLGRAAPRLTEAAAAPAASQNAGLFVFCDENAPPPTATRDQENTAPSGFVAPAQTAAAEASSRTGSARSVLGPVAGITTEPLE